jgi:hypothetical protein
MELLKALKNFKTEIVVNLALKGMISYFAVGSPFSCAICTMEIHCSFAETMCLVWCCR